MRRRCWMGVGAMALIAPLRRARPRSRRIRTSRCRRWCRRRRRRRRRGDYATDVLGDPWDFSNDEDVPPIPLIGSENGLGISRVERHPHGHRRSRTPRSSSSARGASQLPWGRDGMLTRSTPTGTRGCRGRCACRHGGTWASTSSPRSGGEGLLAIFPEEGCHQYTVDLTDRVALPVRRRCRRAGPVRSSGSSCSPAARSSAGNPAIEHLARLGAPPPRRRAGDAARRAARRTRAQPERRGWHSTTPPRTATRGTTPTASDVASTGDIAGAQLPGRRHARHDRRATTRSSSSRSRRRSSPIATTAPPSTSATTVR